MEFVFALSINHYSIPLIYYTQNTLHTNPVWMMNFKERKKEKLRISLFCIFH